MILESSSTDVKWDDENDIVFNVILRSWNSYSQSIESLYCEILILYHVEFDHLSGLLLLCYFINI